MKKFNNKKIAFLGLGIENLAFINWIIEQKIPCELTICDPLNEDKLRARLDLIKGNETTKIILNLSDDYDRDLDKHDVIVRSPGYPLHSEKLLKLDDKLIEITSAMSCFFEACECENIIGVTGTKGKGTTSSLIFSILKTAKKDVFLGGNIGVAPFDFIDKVKKDSFVILELSSFQLEDMNISPRIAVITNLYKDHLLSADPKNPNYHKTLDKYWQAKLNIIKFQDKDGVAVICKNIKKQKITLETKAQKFYFEKSEIESNLLGEHNKENIDAARIVAEQLDIKKEDIEKGVKNFNSLPHRIEFIADKNGIKYYNDSYATTPDATRVALKSFENPIILLAGGADKGSDFDSFAKEVKNKVKLVILFPGEANFRIKEALLKNKYPEEKIKTVYNMKDAIDMASKQGQEKDIVLLSTACASFGLFKNYKERGELFGKEVNNL